MKKKITKLKQTESPDNDDSAINTQVKELNKVEKKYKEVLDTSKLEALAKAAPQISAPVVAESSTTRIGNTVNRLEKDLSDSDKVAAEYIDNAVLKHVDFVLPK